MLESTSRIQEKKSQKSFLKWVKQSQLIFSQISWSGFSLTLQLITTTFIKTVPITLNASVLKAYINYILS